MDQVWLDRWNERYKEKEFAYGELPNNYFKEQILKLKPGKILFPAEGEGRNSVYAAKLGWDVYAFDISEEGLKKAKSLAVKNNVMIDYQVGELKSLNYKPNQFDVIALIYAHFPADLKSNIHASLNKLLRKEGYVIFEAFSKSHIKYNSVNEAVGGPKEIDMLFSIDEIKSDFKDFEIIELKEMEVELHEGMYHNGLGSVIRFVGKKK